MRRAYIPKHGVGVDKFSGDWMPLSSVHFRSAGEIQGLFFPTIAPSVPFRQHMVFEIVLFEHVMDGPAVLGILRQDAGYGRCRFPDALYDLEILALLDGHPEVVVVVLGDD